MKLDKGRDLARTGEILEEWLRQRLDLVRAEAEFVMPTMG